MPVESGWTFQTFLPLIGLAVVCMVLLLCCGRKRCHCAGEKTAQVSFTNPLDPPINPVFMNEVYGQKKPFESPVYEAITNYLQPQTYQQPNVKDTTNTEVLYDTVDPTNTTVLYDTADPETILEKQPTYDAVDTHDC